MIRHRKYRWALFLAVMLATGITAATRLHSQRGMFIEPNAKYDGRFTFVRLRYDVYRRSGWEFDYPTMERNFMTIVQDLTTLHPHVRESNVHDMDDPELTKYAVAYLSEPGYWVPNESQATGLRNWMLKGGFLIVDDFYWEQWDNFERSMRMVLPKAKFVRLDVSHPIFDSFFKIVTLDGLTHPESRNARAEYFGIYEDNDPSKRLMAIVNYNNDIGDYMEWSGQGWYAVNLSNDAYKFATNYLVYGLTH
ncbi:MAG: DUF4159 domain-containing protein [Gemmatimonas sp.]